jgi:SOS-response transcriptional repressor LexA
MSRLTLQQHAVLGFIARYLSENGRAPSMSEIAEGTGLPGTTTAWNVVQQLEAAGKVRTKPGKHRSTQLLEYVPGASA